MACELCQTGVGVGGWVITLDKNVHYLLNDPCNLQEHIFVAQTAALGRKENHGQKKRLSSFLYYSTSVRFG